MQACRRFEPVHVGCMRIHSGSAAVILMEDSALNLEHQPSAQASCHSYQLVDDLVEGHCARS